MDPRWNIYAAAGRQWAHVQVRDGRGEEITFESVHDLRTRFGFVLMLILMY